MKKIVASNFKTNHTRVSTKEFISKVDSFVKTNSVENEIFIFPTSLSIDSFDISNNIFIGVQNAYPVDEGSFSGEIGSKQLDEFDIKTILIGHSERRHILKEDSSLIVEKYNYYKDLGYKIVYCIGEPYEVKLEGRDSIINYLETQLENIDLSYENLIIAYEPVWAIGTGKVATLEDIQEIHGLLKEKFYAPLLYGGSVKVDNIEEILKLKSVDGVLVGSGSWKCENFIDMIDIAKKIK